MNILSGSRGTLIPNVYGFLNFQIWTETNKHEWTPTLDNMNDRQTDSSHGTLFTLHGTFFPYGTLTSCKVSEKYYGKFRRTGITDETD